MKIKSPHWPTLMHLVIIVIIGYVILRTFKRKR